MQVAEHYDSVLATDVSSEQLLRAAPHPKVRYLHTPDATPGEDLVAALGGEGSVDLITVAEAVHWFDLPAFYAVACRVLRRPGGVIAVWGYNYRVSPVEDMMARFVNTTLPYRDPRARYSTENTSCFAKKRFLIISSASSTCCVCVVTCRYYIEGYRNLPFPFDDVGLGREGEPWSLDMEHEMSFEGLIGMLRSSSAVTTAKQRGVDLLGERMVKELEEGWGGPSLVRRVTFKAFLLAGSPRADDD